MSNKKLTEDDGAYQKSTADGGVRLYGSSVQAGFPSPAGDDASDVVDLNRLLAPHAASTFCVRVTGDSMTGAGIDEGDLLVVDRSLTASDGSVVLCYVDNAFTVKSVSLGHGEPRLVPANGRYPDLVITADSDARVWGVVTWVIKKMGRLASLKAKRL